MKNLVTFKRHGKVTASRLTPKFLRNYRKDGPICVAMRMRRKSIPKGPNSVHELDHLVPWEEVFTDSSGKFRQTSKQGNNYFTVFVCGKTGDKIDIPHVKRKQAISARHHHARQCAYLVLRAQHEVQLTSSHLAASHLTDS
jgi:hypothetical protein